MRSSCLAALLFLGGLTTPVFAQDERPVEPDVAAAIADLGSDKPAVRAAAVQSLREMGARAARAAEALADALADPVKSVRRDAARALYRSGARSPSLSNRLEAALDIALAPDAGNLGQQALVMTYARIPHGPEKETVLRGLIDRANRHASGRDHLRLSLWCATRALDTSPKDAPELLRHDDIDADLRGRAMRVFLASASLPDAPIAEVMSTLSDTSPSPAVEWLRAVPPGDAAIDAVAECVRTASVSRAEVLWIIVDRLGARRTELVPHRVAVLDANIPGGPDGTGRVTALLPMRDHDVRLNPEKSTQITTSGWRVRRWGISGATHGSLRPRCSARSHIPT